MKLGLMGAVLCLVGSALCLTMLGCPPGTKVAADLDVKVDPSSCREDPAHAAALSARGSLSNDLVSLACTSLDGGVSVHVEFPRKTWHEMVDRTEDGGAKTFPGK